LLMIVCTGIGGGPGWGTDGMRFTSNFGGGGKGPSFCASTANDAPRSSTASHAGHRVIELNRFIAYV
jgi:hypothetical protein